MKRARRDSRWAQIVAQDRTGLEVDLGELLLQARHPVGGIAGDVGVAVSLADIGRVDDGKLVGGAGIEDAAVDLAAREVDLSG